MQSTIPESCRPETQTEAITAVTTVATETEMADVDVAIAIAIVPDKKTTVPTTETHVPTILDQALYAKCLVVLQQQWGYTSFRKGQYETIEQVLLGNDTLFITATGQGKVNSIAFNKRHKHDSQNDSQKPFLKDDDVSSLMCLFCFVLCLALL